MKVLLVTNQLIDIRDDACYCDFALWGTLKNMSMLGDLYIVACKQSLNKPASQPLNKKVDFIIPERVNFLHPINRASFSFFINKRYNRKLMEECIPSMDLVIGYAPSMNVDQAFKIARKYHIPFLTFLVGCPWDALHNHSRIPARLMAPVCWYTTRHMVEKSDYVHYVTKEFLQNRYPTQGKSLGCSDVNLGFPNPEALNSRLLKISELNTDSIIKLMTTANIDVRYKGHEYVFKAIAKMKEQGDQRYHYYLIGAGEGKFLRELSIKLGIEKQIHFEGRKTPEEVINMLCKSDIYIQPSLQEGLPRAVVEAMSVALPCVGFNTGGIPELLEPEFVVRRKNVDGIIQCLRLLQNVEKYKKTARKNFNKSFDYEHSKLTNQIRDFFKDVRNEIKSK